MCHSLVDILKLMQKVDNSGYRDPDYNPRTMNGTHHYSTGLHFDDSAHIERHQMRLQDDSEAEIIVPDDYNPFSGSECLQKYPARNQGSCGSCYAFAAATMLSLRYCLAGVPRKHHRYIQHLHLHPVLLRFPAPDPIFTRVNTHHARTTRTHTNPLPHTPHLHAAPLHPHLHAPPPHLQASGAATQSTRC